MQEKGKVHFIAIGGSAMHNLAIALTKIGYQVSGSDDQFLDPSRSRLEKAGILPAKEGWYPDQITQELSAVIVGIHATKDNPELLKAQQLGLKISSFADFVYEQCQDKQRIVIAGSHGKTTIGSMILHVLKLHNRKFDYLLGIELEGMDTTIKLSEDAPLIIIEGDDYLSSPVDLSPKFLHYNHHIALFSGIAWDNFNIYPTFDEYVKQFELLADATPKGGSIVFSEEDDLLTVIGRKEREDVQRIEYKTHKHTISKGKTYLETDEGKIPLHVFGTHNLSNISAAKAILMKLGITNSMFYAAIKSFSGTSNSLELLAENSKMAIYKDFAQSPTKIKAATKAVKEQFPERKVVAIVELLSPKSLNKQFLSQFKDSFEKADHAYIYYNPKTIENKRLQPLTESDLIEGFNSKELTIFTDKNQLKVALESNNWDNTTLLFMTSGNFDQISLNELATKLINK